MALTEHFAKFFREAELRKSLGISHSTIWRWVRAGRFPKPVRIGQAAIAWPADEILRWIESKKAEREDGR